MTRAASSRKNSTGGPVSSRPGPVFRGRDVVFVDPLDEKESYWWPAMIVPVPEIDSSMDCTVLNPGECLVKYFEDNKYSVVPFTDLQPFVPTTIPFLEFELEAGQKFLKNGGVVNAMAYLDSGKVKRKFSWHRWGTAQNQELNLDMLKHKPITLPLISDETFQGMQQYSQHTNSSSTASSPTTSTKNYTDSETESRDNVSSPSSADERTTHNPRGNLKNGLQRSLTGVTSQSNPLPSPVSLNDQATESMDETEFNTRSTRAKVEGTATKDSPTTSRSRSRRGSREVDSKVSGAIMNGSTSEKEASKRSRNVSEQPSSSSFSNSNSQSQTISSSPTSLTTVPLPFESTSSNDTKKRRIMPEQHVTTDFHSGVLESGSVSAKSSRQGSAEPGSSPRSTRHSFRNSKVSENNQHGPNEDHSESPQEAVVPTRLQTHRMTRQRSAPKSASSVPSLPPPSPISPEKSNDVKEESNDEALSKETGLASSTTVEQNGHYQGATTKSEESMSMDVDSQGPDSEMNEQELPSSLTATSVSTASSTSSPSSIGPEEGLTSSSLPLSSSNSGLLQSLGVERKEMDYSFEHVLPKLAIGSKEREAFYESCMDHLQKLRQEHRRLKEILKNSDYTPKGRRATRSSPQQHAHNRNSHQHLVEEKPNRRNSPALSKGNSVGGNNKDSNGDNTTISRSNSASRSETATIEEVTGMTISSIQPVYQGSTPSSAILTSNISTTTRRSAATAAAAAVTATVSRSSRQSSNSNSNQSSADKSIESGYTKKRGSSAAAAAAAAALAANDNSAISTRAKRRQR
ncbi:hypothetical protein BGZ49_008749 [Haplosporangium sp. Z 27]|nr:hypothetical protein BGZ49_008749 [Haplosporangium sp. Z 27]